MKVEGLDNDQQVLLTQIKEQLIPQLIEELKGVDIGDIEDTFQGEKIGEVQFGVSGLKVCEVTVPLEEVHLEKKDSDFCITANEIGAKLQQFEWHYKKTGAFPRLKDKGHANASISHSTLIVTIKAQHDEEGKLQLVPSNSEVHVEKLKLKTSGSSVSFLYNIILKLLKKIITQKIQEALSNTVARAIQSKGQIFIDPKEFEDTPITFNERIPLIKTPVTRTVVCVRPGPQGPPKTSFPLLKSTSAPLIKPQMNYDGNSNTNNILRAPPKASFTPLKSTSTPLIKPQTNDNGNSKSGNVIRGPPRTCFTPPKSTSTPLIKVQQNDDGNSNSGDVTRGHVNANKNNSQVPHIKIQPNPTVSRADGRVSPKPPTNTQSGSRAPSKATTTTTTHTVTEDAN